MRQFLLLLSVTVPLAHSSAQNVGINANGAAPAASAMLDIDVTALPAADKRGLLVPRIALTSTAVAAPVVAPAQSLLVYNTNTAGAGLTAVSPGYYYWDGAQWVRFAQDGLAWQLLGNAGTAVATNFLGTTDNVGLRVRTNNFERFEVSTGTGGAAGTGGRLWAFQDGTAASPIYSWSANNNTGIFRPLASTLGFSTNAVERFRIPNANQVHAMADGTAALPFYSWGLNTNLGMYRIGADILGFSTTGTERMRIAANGHVGINGVPANGAILDVQSTNRGVLIPRIALVAASNANPVGAANVAQGLLVFNTATAGTGADFVYPGYYRWDAPAARWRRLVDLNIEQWLTNPINIGPGQTIILTIAPVPGVTPTSGISVNLWGVWAASPGVMIEHVEALNGAVRFRIYNYTLFTTYTGMDFVITVIRP